MSARRRLYGYLGGDSSRSQWVWLRRRGRPGPGKRIVEVGRAYRNLGGKKGSGEVRQRSNVWLLRSARLADCDMSGANLVSCDAAEVELCGCILDDSDLLGANLEGAFVGDCRLRRVILDGVKLRGAEVLLGVWTEIDGIGSDWSRAEVFGVDFRRARLRHATLDHARFVACDFRDARIGRETPRLPRGTAHGTVFERCDLRGADLEGLRLSSTRFVRCGLHGVRGRPALEPDAPAIDGAYEAIDCDFSPDFDGSDLAGTDRLRDLWAPPRHPEPA